MAGPAGSPSPSRRLLLASALALPVLLAGCGDTWRGVKKDTGENLEKTGRALEKAGSKVKN
jgi:predicted small secreted protein